MVPEKRKLVVASAAIAAAIGLAGCAPVGYNASNTSGGQQAAANASDATPEPTDEPTAEPTGEPTAEPTGNPTAEAGGALSEDELTTELTATTIKKMGQVVVDDEGWTLYRFDGDKAKPQPESDCNGDCAAVWPPAITKDGKPELKGVDPSEVGTVTRADGSKQLTIGNWPVYRYLGDKKPGAWKGQNVGGKWFVVQANGAKNLTCLPPVSKPIAPPANSENGGNAGSADNGTGGDYSY